MTPSADPSVQAHRGRAAALAVSLAAAVAAPWPLHGAAAGGAVQVTFTAIEAGDRIVLEEGLLQGAVEVRFTAVDGAASDPRAVAGTDASGRPTIAFAESLPAGLQVVMRGETGGEVRVASGYAAPVVVSGGEAGFALETQADESAHPVEVAEQGSPEALLEWLASRQRPDGVIERFVRVRGLAAGACEDGAVDFRIRRQNAPPRLLKAPALCVNYRMARAVHSGQTVALQAQVEGAAGDTRLQFAFSAEEGALSLSRHTVTLGVDEINAGATLTEVTGNLAGGHVFNVTVSRLAD